MSRMHHPNLALLIDGDNAEISLLPEIYAAVSRYGRIIISRIYGNWNATSMNKWRTVLEHLAIQFSQQMVRARGKNATDIELVVDAMDIVNSNHRKANTRAYIDGICIVSSDSDYTRLATRIREEAIGVMGVGRRNTPSAFVQACDLFLFTEDLRRATVLTPGLVEIPGTAHVRDVDELPPPANRAASLEKLLVEAYHAAYIGNEWVDMSAMGAKLRQLEPGFNPKRYGHSQLLKLMQSFNHRFVVKVPNKKEGGVVLIRLKS